MQTHLEYKLDKTPPLYSKNIDLIFFVGALTLFVFIILIALPQFSRVDPYFTITLVSILCFALVILYFLIKSHSRKFPDWKRFHEKTLPPKENPSLLKAEYSLSFKNNLHKIDIGFSVVFACVGLALITGSFVTGSQKISLLLFGTGILIVCLWNIKRLKQVTAISPTPIITATAESIIFPLTALEITHTRKLLKHNKTQLEISWPTIREWIVDSGGSEDPDLYRITLHTGSTYEVYRSIFMGREIAFLEYVRAAGVTIVLRTSIAR